MIRSHILLAAVVGVVVLLGFRLEDVLKGDIQAILSGAAKLNAFRTFSGVFTLVGVTALLTRHFTVAAVLFIIDGAAGTGIFWDRWSQATGEHFQLSAIMSGSTPTQGDIQLLVTHLPLLIIGTAILFTISRRKEEASNAA